ncbi:MAG: DNA primase [Bacteroidota bacterium]
MRIHENTISEIQNRLQIEAVIGEHINLKKKGKDLWGLCPFHHEKTPSFSVAPKLGFYKCFGCGASGDAITFLMQYQHLSYVEVLHLLAEKYGITISKTPKNNPKATEEKKEEEILYQLLNTAKDFYHHTLTTKNQAQTAADYLKKRGITQPLIEKFQLGYSPNQWKSLYQHTIQKGYTIHNLQNAGLAIEKAPNVYDRFRDRIMFPIHNLAGLVVGFGARRINNDTNTPKYINSPETNIYKKSYILYGLYQAKQAIQQKNFCYLVEGYTDVLALHREKINHVVASSGTSLTQEQVQLLSRFTKSIVLLFDNDTAGTEATLRSIKLLLAQGMHIKIIQLPPGEDPESYATKQGQALFAQYLSRHAQDFITFQTQSLLAKNKANDPQTKLLILEEMVNTLSHIPDLGKRNIYIQACSKLLEIPSSTFTSSIDKLNQKQTHYRNLHNKQSPHTDPVLSAEKNILYILLHYGQDLLDTGETYATYLIQELTANWFYNPTYKNLFQAFKKAWLSNNRLNAQTFIQNEPEPIKKTAVQIMANRYSLGAWDKYYQVNIPQEYDNLSEWCLKTLQYLKLAHLQKELSQQLKTLQIATSTEETNASIKAYQALKQEAKQIAQQIGIVIKSTSPQN